MGKLDGKIAVMARESCAADRYGRRRDRPNKDEAIAAIALCVGGMMLSRAVDDPKLSDKNLSACRAAVVKERVASVTSGP